MGGPIWGSPEMEPRTTPLFRGSIWNAKVQGYQGSDAGTMLVLGEPNFAHHCAKEVKWHFSAIVGTWRSLRNQVFFAKDRP